MTFEYAHDGPLGGFIIGGDSGSWNPKVWDKLIEDYNIKSVIDVGCGEGHSSKYFADKGIDVLAIDGSKKALDTAVYEPIIIHDYNQAALIPPMEYDLVWCCEFLEHVDEEFMQNYLETFKYARVLAVTHALPNQGGYHHVNEKDDAYWINKIEAIGFKFNKEKTEEYRAMNEATYFPISGMIFEKI